VRITPSGSLRWQVVHALGAVLALCALLMRVLPLPVFPLPLPLRVLVLPLRWAP
jgi:hypothetical protein